MIVRLSRSIHLETLDIRPFLPLGYSAFEPYEFYEAYYDLLATLNSYIVTTLISIPPSAFTSLSASLSTLSSS